MVYLGVKSGINLTLPEVKRLEGFVSWQTSCIATYRRAGGQLLNITNKDLNGIAIVGLT